MHLSSVVCFVCVCFFGFLFVLSLCGCVAVWLFVLLVGEAVCGGYVVHVVVARAHYILLQYPH